MPDATNAPDLRALIESVRAETAPPTSIDPLREAVRLRVVMASIEHGRKHWWNEPLGRAFARLWASIDPSGALSLPGASPGLESSAPGLELLSVLPSDDRFWIGHPWGLGRHDMGVGYAYWGAIRRRAFELDAASFDRELSAAASLRARVIESDRDDRMTMLYILAFVFARDGRWAREHVDEILETPKLGSFLGSDLLLPSLTDAFVAQKLVAASPSWINSYGWNLPLLFDVVEALGSDAAPVLGKLSTSSFKSGVKKTVDEAIALANS